MPIHLYRTYGRTMKGKSIILEKSKTASPDRSKSKINLSKTNDSIDTEEVEQFSSEDFLKNEIKTFKQKLNQTPRPTKVEYHQQKRRTQPQFSIDDKKHILDLQKQLFCAQEELLQANKQIQQYALLNEELERVIKQLKSKSLENSSSSRSPPKNFHSPQMQSKQSPKENREIDQKHFTDEYQRRYNNLLNENNALKSYQREMEMQLDLQQKEIDLMKQFQYIYYYFEYLSQSKFNFHSCDCEKQLIETTEKLGITIEVNNIIKMQMKKLEYQLQEVQSQLSLKKSSKKIEKRKEIQEYDHKTPKKNTGDQSLAKENKELQERMKEYKKTIKTLEINYEKSQQDLESLQKEYNEQLKNLSNIQSASDISQCQDRDENENLSNQFQIKKAVLKIEQLRKQKSELKQILCENQELMKNILTENQKLKQDLRNQNSKKKQTKKQTKNIQKKIVEDSDESEDYEIFDGDSFRQKNSGNNKNSRSNDNQAKIKIGKKETQELEKDDKLIEDYKEALIKQLQVEIKMLREELDQLKQKQNQQKLNSNENQIVNDISVDDYIKEVNQAKKVLDGMIRAVNVMKQKARQIRKNKSTEPNIVNSEKQVENNLIQNNQLNDLFLNLFDGLNSQEKESEKKKELNLGKVGLMKSIIELQCVLQSMEQTPQQKSPPQKKVMKPSNSVDMQTQEQTKFQNHFSKAYDV